MFALLTLTLAACPAPDGTPQRPDSARLAFLARELGSAGVTSTRWTAVWGSTYAVTAIGQLVPVPWIAEGEKSEWFVAAATSAVGLAWVLRESAEVVEAGPAFVARARADGADVCALIAEGEGLLARGAAHQSGVRAWYAHGLNLAINLAIGIAFAFAYDKAIAGAVNVAIGAVLGELTLFTAPKRLVSAWAEYQRGEVADPESVSLAVSAGGLLLRF